MGKALLPAPSSVHNPATTRAQPVNTVPGTRVARVPEPVVTGSGHARVSAVKISENTQVYLTEHITEQVTNSRSDKLPNVLSIYEALLLNRKFLKNFSFDISKSSEFGKAFDEMVREKGTGVGRVLSKDRDEWEWELYERIKDGAIALDDNLLDRKNEDILEKLWGEVHPLSRYVNDQEDWDEQRRERLALGGSLQSPGQN
ncbi:hypothetical protein C8R42DRAFT_779011 [Lentinula raphanica]|nr:hypothetical protein C8R42DRAFT_779011 [Lentinula raphanica]